MVVLHIALRIARTVPYADAAGDSLTSAPRGAKPGITRGYRAGFQPGYCGGTTDRELETGTT
jgi:hypothetical protein